MLKPIVPLLEYVVYEDYITEFLCINKDRTELNCNGKCYLIKRLEEQKEDKKENLPKISMEEYPIGFIELIGLPNAQEKTRHLTNHHFYTNNYLFLFCKGAFHPPNTSC